MEEVKKTPVQKTPEQEQDDKHSVTNYKKSIFTFSEKEWKDIEPLAGVAGLAQGFMNMAVLAQQKANETINGYVNNTVIPRLGVKDSKDTDVFYYMDTKIIVVYEPRQWCSNCNARKAEYKYQDKVYCEDCIKPIQEKVAENVTQEKVAEEKIEEKTEEKKNEKKKK